MVNMRDRHVAIPVSLLLSMVLAVVAALVWGGGATNAAPARTADVAAAAERPVAQSAQGKMTSRIFGETANGRDVTGKFVPLKFVKRNNGRVVVRGLLQGVVHNRDGSKRTFAAMRTMRVKTINGEPARPGAASRAGAQGAPACDVLNLVLGPLDLDVLGLQIDLNRVVLNVVAQSGAGKLLGNLLCAVAGLLDGGLGGLLNRLVRLLNRILGQLGLGV